MDIGFVLRHRNDPTCAILADLLSLVGDCCRVTNFYNSFIYLFIYILRRVGRNEA